MRATVVTILEDRTVKDAAKLLAQRDIGSTVVINRKRKPIGIITEGDIIRRIIISEAQPQKVKVKDVMSHPIATIAPDLPVYEAQERMKKLGVRRLLVMEGEKMVGIITRADLLHISPALESLREREKIGIILPKGERVPLAGYCEICGQWADTLLEKDGKILCEVCIAETVEEEKFE